SGKPVVTDVMVVADGLSERDVLGWAARAEAASHHPLARPVLEAAEAAGTAPPPGMELPETTETVPGKGVMAVSQGHSILVGNRALLDTYRTEGSAPQSLAALAAAEAAAAQLSGAGRTPMIVAVDGAVI